MLTVVEVVVSLITRRRFLGGVAASVASCFVPVVTGVFAVPVGGGIRLTISDIRRSVELMKRSGSGPGLDGEYYVVFPPEISAAIQEMVYG